MATLTELTSAQHKDLHIVPDAVMQQISKQHMMNVHATEIANAATCFPVFISRNSINGRLSISALTNLVAGHNLYVSNGHWDPVFRPIGLQTLPLYLMQRPEDPNQFTVGFDSSSECFATSGGEPLFTEDGKATSLLMEKSKLLESELNMVRQTHGFLQAMEKHNLLKSVDLQVKYDNERVNVIQGLYTINEDQLQTMNTEQFEELRKAGYLMPIHALLMSLYQVNVLVNRFNAHSLTEKISEVKIEVSKNLTNN
ncbi:SapC family protein [Alteromonas sp. ASW11-36]|uniref:SapC family protein n=1 Tax=Alteromonas arenosi TaxID=3055817 RepID=A0ABT7SSQ4_9ALTE|nr:SapC family protein [Alteromonas sp. ASW11-36]MDM7859225.1 SapC family protein [Alteromonas sp. ASW11-36]